MTTQQLYQKTLNEQMSHSQFLSAVRKDPQYSNLLTNVMSFEDTVNTLKAKGYISDTNQESNSIKPFDFLGSFRALNEAATKKQKLKGGKGDKLTPDQVNYFEFRKGWQHELEHTDDIEKAKEIALDHLSEDPMYYTRLEMIETKAKKKERSDLPIDISIKKASLKDEKNQMSSVDKKKEKPNVSDSGKKEKARSKSAGIKKMKGGSGEMKSLKESTLFEQDEVAGVFRVVKRGESGSTYLNVKNQKQFLTLMRRNEKENIYDKITPDNNVAKEWVAGYEEKKAEKEISPTPEKVPIVAKTTAPKSEKKPEKIEKDGVTYVGGADPNKPSFYIYKPVIPKQEPHIDIEEYVDGKLTGKFNMPARVFKNNTGVSFEEAIEGKLYPVIKKPARDKIEIDGKFVDRPMAPGEQEKKIEYKIVPKKKERRLVKIAGVGGTEKDITDRPTTEPTKSDVKKTPSTSSTEKNIKGLEDQDWIAIDPTKKTDKIIKVFKSKEEAKSFQSKFPTYIVSRYIEARKRQLFEEKEVSIKEKVKSLIGKPVSFTMPDAQNPDEKSQVSNTVSKASFDSDSNKALFTMNDGAKLYFENIGAEPVGYYFSAEEKGKINKQDPKYKVLQVMSPLKEIIYTKKPKEEEILENYIRTRVRELLKEYDAGPYIGVSGPNVVKKKLEDYLKRYDANWETDPSPKQRSINMEYEDIISQLVDELNNKESGEGDKMVKKYTSKPMAKNAADRSTPPPSTLAYDPTKLVSRGGRIAEGDKTNPIIKKYDATFRNPEANIQDFKNKFQEIKSINRAASKQTRENHDKLHAFVLNGPSLVKSGHVTKDELSQIRGIYFDMKRNIGIN